MITGNSKKLTIPARFAKVKALLMSTLFLITLNACKDDDPGDFVNYAETAVRYVQYEDMMADMFVLFHRAVSDTALVNNGTAIIDSAWVIFSLNLADSSAMLSFDYGTEGKTMPDGSMRKGEIFASWEKPFHHSEVSLLASTQNFMVDDISVNGTYLYHNTGETTSGKIKFEISPNLSFHRNDVKICDLNSERTYFWETGFNEPYKTINHIFSVPVQTITEGNFYEVTGLPVPEISFSTSFAETFFIHFKCDNPIREGNFEIIMSDEDISPVNLSGEFIDTDLDGCAEKVIIKNDENFGYPFYL